MKRCKLFMMSLLLIAVVAGAQAARAADRTWDGGTANWTSEANWSGGVVPAVGDHAIIPDGTVTSTVALNITTSATVTNNVASALTLSGGTLDLILPSGQFLFIAPDKDDDVQVIQTGGTLKFTRGMRVAETGTGSYTMEGGIIDAAQSISVGRNATAIGTMTVLEGTITLPGAGTSTGNGIFIGDIGTGSYTQSGGSLLAGRFILASGTASPGLPHGTVNLTGGTMTFNSTVAAAQNCGIGSTGVGVFTVDGGTLNVDITGAATPFRLGLAETGNGTLILKSGAVNVSTVDFVVGDAGIGVFEMEGGTATMRKVVIGKAATGSGTVSMSGGTLTADSIEKGEGAITGFTWTGGTVSAGTVNLAGTAVANNAGTLAPGGTGVGTTAFVNTNYTQSAGGVLDIELAGASGDQIIIDGGAATIAGTIQVAYAGERPSSGQAWDIVTTANSGTLNVGALSFVPPAPAADWTLDTATPGKITVRYARVPAPELSHDAGTTITFAPIYLNLAQTSQDATFTITNAGELDLNISSIVANPSSATEAFSVVSPAAPLTITSGNSEPVTLRFIGTIDGRYLGTLTIASNDPDFPEIVINLVGTVRDETDPAAVKEWWLY